VVELTRDLEIPTKSASLALLAVLIAELRVNSRSEILPTYRVGASKSSRS
jgi:hypothetical protein